MFQNIASEREEVDDTLNEQTEVKKNEKIKAFLKKTFTKQNIIIYILSFMLSMVNSVNGMAPFGLAIFAACISNAIPAGIVFVLTLIGTGIRIWRKRSFNIYFNCACFCCYDFNF